MTRHWTLADSRLIAERVMEWQVTEHNGRLFLADSSQCPAWMEELGMQCSAIPDWPNDPAAAAMALAAIQMDGWMVELSFWTASSHTYYVRLRHPITSNRAEGVAPTWPEAVMLAVLAAVQA
jgi:hypothetical protein